MKGGDGFFQIFADLDVLRTDFLALTAFDAVFGKFITHAGDVELFPALCAGQIIIKYQHVHR